jgi:hypothetical protein
VGAEELPMRTYRGGWPKPGGQSLEPADRAVLRAIGAITLIAIAAMHFLQIVPTFEATPLLGTAFVLFIIACLVVAARLVTRDDRRTWVAAGVVCVAALGGYAFTRLLSTPFDNQDVGNWSCMLGMAALFVEGLVVALSAHVVSLGVAAQQPAAATADLAARRRPARELADREAG